MKKDLLILVGIMFFFCCDAQKADTISDYNGTYNSPTNLFKNNNYIRVHFFNDSIFAFTIIQAYNPSENGEINAKNKDLRLNGHSFFGIARLLNYNGIKSWIGVSDFSPSDDPGDPSYLSLSGRGDFNAVLKALNNTHGLIYNNSYLEYNVYQFFIQKDKLEMKGIRGINRFFEVGNYHKIDDHKMIFGILSDDNYFKANHESTAPAIIKETCQLKVVPIQEKILENSTNSFLGKGDKVYLTGRSFMKYAFVIKFDNNYNVIKYGWLAREFLQKEK